MNHLNSVLIEGNILRDAEMQDDDSCAVFTFGTNRWVKKSEDLLEKVVSFFTVKVTSPTLAKACISKGKQGRGVRVVGRLEQVRANGADDQTDAFIYIVAEHLEFRPTFKDDDPPEASEDS